MCLIWEKNEKNYDFSVDDLSDKIKEIIAQNKHYDSVSSETGFSKNGFVATSPDSPNQSFSRRPVGRIYKLATEIGIGGKRTRKYKKTKKTKKRRARSHKRR